MLTSDPAGQRYVGGGSGSVGEMLRWVEEKCLHQPVVNLAEYPTELSVGWYYYASGKVYQRPTEAGRREATEAFLDIRARQTGLTFTVEPRDVEVWRLEPRADPPQAAGCQ
ncbi:MAG: hypothetical protein GX591_16715 [Planctomycetes bacterium]|nr:hypothetical protein [Planctomycetota bacterium]